MIQTRSHPPGDTAEGTPDHLAHQTMLGYLLGVANILHTLSLAMACLTPARATITAPCQGGKCKQSNVLNCVWGGSEIPPDRASEVCLSGLQSKQESWLPGLGFSWKIYLGSIEKHEQSLEWVEALGRKAQEPVLLRMDLWHKTTNRVSSNPGITPKHMWRKNHSKHKNRTRWVDFNGLL